jgi:uncharacterized protein YyaL (SSP411 family)
VTNRLATEQSPYLLQHAHNPVEWYAWGEEAFAKAKAQDKPIFLSVGYSTCHWCHVMEHESFEDPDVAALLNEHFVSIKVDREERPDVDRVYMTFVQATTGSGGWPMSVWLTPDLEPFYGGTYYPPTSQWGRPGFRDLLLEIARAWRDERDQVVRSATQIIERLTAATRHDAGGATIGPEALASTLREFRQSFDARFGGFGDQPKFPRPSELLFLLREHARTGDEDARRMALQTLTAMALGGMRDHIGGGFHRYSVDRQWRVPHFEKMLYDQAQLVLAYLEAAQVSGDAFFAQVAEDTLQYVERDLSDEAGGFHSAEDADSIPPEQADRANARKTEGAFYIWSIDELREALGDESGVFELRYGIVADGNAPFDPQNEFGRKNLLYTARGIADVARETGLEPERVAATLARARETLFHVRARRPRPHLDDKVLTAWNGLMIAAYARGARVLGVGGALGDSVDTRALGARHLRTAERAAQFFKEAMWDPGSGRLRRRYRRGHAAIDGYAEDYAFLVFGLLELFQANGDAQLLQWALALQQRMDDWFWDARSAGWFSTRGEDRSVLLRLKEDHDGAEPSPTSVGALNLLTLFHLTGDAQFRDRAARALASLAPRLAAAGRAVPMMAAVVSMTLAETRQIVILGDSAAQDTLALRTIVERHHRPFTVVVPVAPGEGQRRLAERLPWIGAMSMLEGRATAYVCREFACDAPVTDPGLLEEALAPQGA